MSGRRGAGGVLQWGGRPTGTAGTDTAMGQVEIFSAGLSLRRLHGVPGEQVLRPIAPHSAP